MPKQPKRPQPSRPRKSPPDSNGQGKGEFRSSADVQTGLILGATFGIKPVQYAVVDGLAIFEGDIVLGTADQVVAQTEHLRAVSTGQVEMGVIRTGTQFRWPNRRVPYDIDSSLPSQNRVTDAIAHWEANTQFRFILRTSANASQFPDWVTFRPSGGCSSSVGRQGGQQFVNLGSGCSTGNTIHEIGHVVGLWHEQSREDRDSFVTIHWVKIQPGFEHNFNQHITDGDDVGVYDYGSIMHYPRNAFSVDGTDTITPVDPTATIGQRTALSPGDIGAANSMCEVKLFKEPPFETLKEVIKDIRLDTKKELILDTKKELIKDRIKEVVKEIAFDPPYAKGVADPILPGRLVTQPVLPGRLGLTTRPIGMPGGALPFAVAVPHHAPAAGGGAVGGGPAGATAEAAAQLDAQLQGLADALVQTEATLANLQQQYDATASLLKQVLDSSEQGGGM